MMDYCNSIFIIPSDFDLDNIWRILIDDFLFVKTIDEYGDLVHLWNTPSDECVLCEESDQEGWLVEYQSWTWIAPEIRELITNHTIITCYHNSHSMADAVLKRIIGVLGDRVNETLLDNGRNVLLSLADVKQQFEKDLLWDWTRDCFPELLTGPFIPVVLDEPNEEAGES